MPAKKGSGRSGAKQSRSARPARRDAVVQKGEPIIRRSDVRRILLELVVTLAPADIAELMGREKELRARVKELDPARFALLRAQLVLALDILHDHLEGACPQIPYYTVSLLAGAVWYFADAIDIIPDFLPRIGNLDDAAVSAMAFQLGRKGVLRYCDWKEIDSTVVLGRTGRTRV